MLYACHYLSDDDAHLYASAASQCYQDIIAQTVLDHHAASSISRSLLCHIHPTNTILAKADITHT
jgi:hypothetical protein